jgi:hypothetical protein
MIIVSIICFAACLALIGVVLYFLMKFAIGHEAINIYDKINLWDVMMGEPHLLGIYMSLIISIGMFSFQIIIKVVRWIFQVENEVIE